MKPFNLPFLIRSVAVFMIFSILQSCFLPNPKAVKIPVDFDWEGHRGCRGLRPENSIPAFIHALDFPEIRTLELDVVISKDRQIVVSHEPFFNHEITLSPTGDTLSKGAAMALNFYEMNLADIQKYDCGSRGNPKFPDQVKMKTVKPTLRQVVEAIQKEHPGRSRFWNIEIKSHPDYYGKAVPQPADFARLLLAELRALGIESASVIQSFDVNPLKEVKKQGTSARLALLVENGEAFEANIGRLGFQPDIYSPYHLFVTKKLVRQCHEKDIKIIPWTVNDASRMKKLIAAGVDGIITDYPNLIAECRLRIKD